MRSVILFLTVRNMSAADIHRLVTEVYGTEAKSDSKVRKWSRKFKDGTFIETKERTDRLYNQLNSINRFLRGHALSSSVPTRKVFPLNSGNSV
ncbi:hypothetical protein TNCV_2577011 [Trichonephila clavipes]|nr:hypothetical protein TNCV_2577011 [Trichonephila clavipes]